MYLSIYPFIHLYIYTHLYPYIWLTKPRGQGWSAQTERYTYLYMDICLCIYTSTHSSIYASICIYLAHQATWPRLVGANEAESALSPLTQAASAGIGVETLRADLKRGRGVTRYV